MPFKWFETFWDLAVKKAKKEHYKGPVLLRLGADWDDWWGDPTNLEAEERQRILAIKADRTTQDAFVNWILTQKGKWWKNPQSGKLVLFHLAHEAPFNSWTGLDAYRNLEAFPFTQAIILPPKGKPTKDAIYRMAVVLVAKEEAGQLDYHPINFRLGDDKARLTLSAVRNEIFRLVGLLGFARLFAYKLFWGKRLFRGKDHARDRFDKIRLAGWGTLAIALLLLLSADPFLYFADDSILLPLLAGLFLIFVPLSIHGATRILSEGYKGWQQASRWKEILKKNCLCVIIRKNKLTQPPLKIEGPSYGLSLFLCVLSALHEETSASVQQSGIWSRVFDSLKERRSWALTGEVLGNTLIGPVNRLEDKYLAALDAGSPCLVTPRQKEARNLRQTKQQEFPSSASVNVGQAAGGSELKLKSYRGITNFLMEIGDLKNDTLRGTIRQCIINITIFIIVTMVSLTLPCFYDTVFLGGDPVLNFEQINHSSNFGFLWLRLKSADPTSFGVRLNSGYWMNRQTHFHDSQWGPYSGMVEIELRVNLDPNSDNPYDIEIELIRVRRYWLLNLPPLPVLRTSLSELMRMR
jgi:hypothetical protein